MRERTKSTRDFSTSNPHFPDRTSARDGEDYFLVRSAQTIEFFAGGNDEIELRVDGELLLRRSLAEGMRTVGRKVRVDAGAHEIAVDYQQFGGSMALNIQRALEGQQPSPFSPTELFAHMSTRAMSCCSTRRAGCAETRHMYGRVLPFC